MAKKVWGLTRSEAREMRLGYWLLAPSAVLMAAVIGYPLINTFRDAFGVAEGVGFANFHRLLEPPVPRVLVQTVVWVSATVGLEVLIGLTLALALNEEFRGHRLARVLLLLPWVTPLAVGAMMWRWLFTFRYGLVTYGLTSLGITKLTTIWLGDPIRGFTANVIAEVWTGIPLMTLILLAGLQSVPVEVKEAAIVDGATWLQTLFRVTLPIMRPIVVTASMLYVILTFNSFPVIWVMTGGGPLNRTDTLLTYTYKLAFRDQLFPQAAAMAIITLVVLLAFAFFYAQLYFSTED